MLLTRSLRVDPFHDEETNMTFNKALIALALGFALAACSNQQQAEEAAADASAAATDAPSAIRSAL